MPPSGYQAPIVGYDLSTAVSMAIGQPAGDQVINYGIEYKSDVRAGDLEIHAGFAGFADAPVHDTVGLRIDGSLGHGFRKPRGERFQEIARAIAGIAGRQNTLAVPVQDLQADQF